MTDQTIDQKTKMVRTPPENDLNNHPGESGDSILKTIYQISPGLLFYLDKNGVITHYLTHPAVVFFQPPAVCVGQVFLELLPKHLTGQFLSIMAQTNQSGMISSTEYELQNGELTRFYSAQSVLVQDGNQVIILRDITAQKQQAEAAQKHRRLLDSLHESARQLISELESEGLGDKITRASVEKFGAREAWLGWLEASGKLVELGYASQQTPSNRAVENMRPTLAEMNYLLECRNNLLNLPPSHGTSPGARALFPLISEDQVMGVLSLTVESAGFFTPEIVDVFQTFSLLAGSALKNARMFEDSRRQLRQIQTLRYIDQAILSNLDLKSMAGVLLKETAKHIHVDALSLLVLDPKTQTLNFVDGFGFRTETLTFSHLKIGESFAGQVAQEKRVVHVQNLEKDPRSFSKAHNFSKEGFKMYLGTPLIAHSELRGVLEVFQRDQFEPDENWLFLLETLANQIAIAIDNKLMVKFLQDTNLVLNSAYDATIEGLSRALELRDRETEGHTRRVAKMTLALARRMGVRQDELAAIHQGALLHDIGKMGIPDAILLKPGPLMPDEWAIMKQHPLYANQILSQIDHLQGSVDIPLYHHEKWDGTGYPFGLKGRQIPYGARLFSIVDVYDALLSTRPYHTAWPKNEALEYLQSQAGISFDPEIVPVFCQLIQENTDLANFDSPIQ